MSVDDIRNRLLAGMNVRARPMAEAAGMSPAAFYKAIERKEIEAVIVGRNKLIPPHEGMRLLGMKPNTASRAA